jgi:hypothetical protein
MDFVLDNDDSTGVDVELGGGHHGKQRPGISIERPKRPRKDSEKHRAAPKKRVSWAELEKTPDSKDVFETLNDFANPEKKLDDQPDQPNVVVEEPDDDDDGSFDDEQQTESDGDDSLMMEDPLNRRDEEDMEYVAQQPEVEKPSDKYASLDDERSDLLCQLERFRKRGFKNIRQFTMHSNLRELRAEVSRITRETQLEQSIKFQRKALVALVSGIELLNGKFNPLDLHLDGFSEHTLQNINDYTTCFEELFFKYRHSVDSPPEVKLLLTLGSSAFMYHLSNTFFKSGGASAAMQSPLIVEQLAKTMQQQQQQQQQQAPQQQQFYPQQPQQGGGRHEMQPPSFDFGSLFPGQMMPPPVPSNNLVPRPSVQEVVEQRSPPKKQTADTGGDDRLSDIISDVGSIPSDLDLDDAEDIQKDIQKVTVPEPKKKRGAKKNVVVI